MNKWASFCEEVARLIKMLSSNPEAVLGSLKLPNGRFYTLDEETEMPDKGTLPQFY